MSTKRRRDTPGEDASLDSAWRAASRDEPPASVDAAILAAARAELRPHGGARQPRRAWWSTWQPLAAAAAVAGLAFVLVQTLPEQGAPRAPALTPALTEDASSAATEQAWPEADAGVAAEPPTAVVAAPGTPPSAQRRESPSEATGPLMPSAPVAAARQRATEATEEVVEPSLAPPPPGASVQTRAGRAAADREAAADSSTAGLAAYSAGRPSAEAWVDRIVASYEAGDLSGAAAQLAAFRQAHPGADQHLPDDLRQWAASVPAPLQESPP